jgi:quercetin dioxygenase-like cupin family protein
MKVSRLDGLTLEPLRNEYLTGEVEWSVMFNDAADKLRVVLARYGPNAQSDWHTHSGGQVSYILEGSGTFQSWGGDEQVVHAGDIVVAEPDERHRHGAGPTTSVLHLLVRFGSTVHLGFVLRREDGRVERHRHLEA